MARYALARVHIQRGEIEDAIAQGLRAVELNPTDSNFLSSLALDLSYSGRLDRAIEFARRAAELNPSPPDWTSIVFAIHHYSNEDYDQALEAISRVTVSDDPQHLMHRAAILAQLGRIEEARTAWDRLTETDARFRVDPEGEVRRRFHSTELGGLYLHALRKAWLEDAGSADRSGPS
jgi:Flp pilus assembly protein TadD